MASDNHQLIDWTLGLLEIQSTNHVLEIGFGPGYGIQRTAELAARGRVAGLELSETMLKEARKLNASAIASGQIELKQGDASSLPYEDNTFDKVFAINVLYFWEEPLAVLSEIKRVMKSGGRVALGFVGKEALEKQKITQTGIYKLYSGEATVQLLDESGFSKAHFEEQAVHYIGQAICAVAEK